MTLDPAPGRAAPPAVAVVVKGYPRLSETFIAQEMLGWSAPASGSRSGRCDGPPTRPCTRLNRQIRAEASYLPEYLYQEPLRVLAGRGAALRRPALGALLRLFWRDLKRDSRRIGPRRLGSRSCWRVSSTRRSGTCTCTTSIRRLGGALTLVS